jgi:hypothetical protein
VKLVPYSWVKLNRAVREIDASRGALGGRTEANVGRILGIVATVLLIVGLAVVVLIFVFGALVSVSSN